tara:strand:- start:602 stop:925 length:324 start_codon:yes stop_codon:yes gene_type:complete
MKNRTGQLKESSLQAKHAWTVSGSDAWQDNVFKTRVRTEGGPEHVYLAACSMAQITISVADQTDKLLSGLLPLRVTIRDSKRNNHDYSDYAYARDGRCPPHLPWRRK